MMTRVELNLKYLHTYTDRLGREHAASGMVAGSGRSRCRTIPDSTPLMRRG
jgi:hypothetical protein